MKRKLAVILSVILCLSLLAFPLSAEVETTAAPTAGAAVYIAGNPELYPVEYYDPETESYKGILPALYQELSAATGLNLCYVRAGSQNEQNRLAENKQVELVSAHVRGDVEELAEELLVLSFPQDGKTVEICVGFTAIASEPLKEQVRSYLSGVSAQQLLELSLRSAEQKTARLPFVLFAAVVAVLAAAVIVLLILLIRGRIQARQRKQNRLVDPLTGIGNGEYLEHYYKNMVSPAARSLYFLAYIAPDTQEWKKYLGSAEGDELQRYAAGVLSSAAGDLDIAARLDDGVFALAFQSPSEEQAGTRMEELLDQMNGYRENLLDEYQTQFKAGIYHLPAAYIPCETALLNARLGYNDAVRQKQRYFFCDESLLKREALSGRLQRKLADAIKRQEFKMYLQFIVDAETGTIRGAEALSRWQNPQEGLLTPAHYIEPMKSAGIIDRLDFYILEQSCRQLEAWSTTEKSGLWLSCNFTRITVSHADFLQRFEEIVGRYHFAHQNLIIELTEDSLADNQAVAYQNILACKNAGFQVALDDLGSGYSSFSDLCDYPVDIIKIDRHIIAKSTTERGNALLRGITELAHNLGIRVLCEGVENETENANAKASGCDYIQGFFYSRTLPAEAAENFYRRYLAELDQ